MFIFFHARYVSLFSELNQSSNFPDRFWKTSKISHSIKVSPVGDELFHADRKRDGHGKVTETFCNFTKAPAKTTNF